VGDDDSVLCGEDSDGGGEGAEGVGRRRGKKGEIGAGKQDKDTGRAGDDNGQVDESAVGPEADYAVALDDRRCPASKPLSRLTDADLKEV